MRSRFLRPSPFTFARRLLTAVLLASLGSLVLAEGQQATTGAPVPQQPAGQDKPAPDPQVQRPTFRTEANFVRVDVYPTADGKPVEDLRQEEFELTEDGVPQQVRTFEHIVIRGNTPQELRAEPNTVRESRQMAADPRARLFVLFIDTYHISLDGAANVRRALVRLLDRTMSSDDLVAIMTPEMSAAAVTFARRTTTIDALLEKFWTWGRRDRIAGRDPIEQDYDACYPPAAGEGATSAKAREMIARRREKLSLDSMEDLIVHLGGLREERKAVFAVTEGWVLYRQNNTLAGNPRIPAVGTGPDGTLRVGDLGASGVAMGRCEQDARRLSFEDHERQFRDLLDEANRANVSFYPIDPRGLPVFDTSIGPDTPLSPAADSLVLGTRLNSLRTLAGATDGTAILNSNDIDGGLRRVVDDLSSYYLIGYYSTNSKLDGKFRSIKVRVKRPGVDVRARRGYKAATEAEVKARTAASVTRPASPLTASVASLARIRTEAFVQARAGYSWRANPAGGPPVPVLWVVGELDAGAAARDEQWKPGADVAVTITGPDKAALDGLQKLLTRDARSFLVQLPPTGGVTPGDYTLRISSKPAGTTLGSTETIRVVVPKPPVTSDAPVAGQPLLFRRGPFSGAGWVAAGDLRFRRQERVKVEVPLIGAFGAAEVRLLDRAGNPLNLPVTLSRREEEGVTVVGGEVTLAPLSSGDYVLETTITQGPNTQKVLAAFRIVP
ncbi:MAG TPA: VWA domain-containing protein [Vicinamibacterales bacterium]|jgi:VWFA-related protein